MMWKILIVIFRHIVAIILVLAQQLFVLILALMVMNENETAGMITRVLHIPMLWMNYWTWKYVCKYGSINFATMNADTSEIDVKKGERWYDDKKR
jgi:hypothetical protein